MLSSRGFSIALVVQATITAGNDGHQIITCYNECGVPSDSGDAMVASANTARGNDEDIGGEWASDGVCDDGGDGATFDSCELGADCTDCGPRSQSVDAATVGGPSNNPVDYFLDWTLTLILAISNEAVLELLKRYFFKPCQTKAATARAQQPVCGAKVSCFGCWCVSLALDLALITLCIVWKTGDLPQAANVTRGIAALNVPGELPVVYSLDGDAAMGVDFRVTSHAVCSFHVDVLMGIASLHAVLSLPWHAAPPRIHLIGGQTKRKLILYGVSLGWIPFVLGLIFQFHKDWITALNDPLLPVMAIGHYTILGWTFVLAFVQQWHHYLREEKLNESQAEAENEDRRGQVRLTELFSA